MSAPDTGSGIESSDWNRLGSVFYERRKLYDWNLEVRNHRVASAKNGGPIALVTDDPKRVVKVTQSQGNRAHAVIPVTELFFISSGMHLSGLQCRWATVEPICV